MNSESQKTKGQATGSPRSQAAVILASPSSQDRTPAPELARVGTLPILLRAILSAHSAKFDRIFVVVDQVRAREFRHELASTGRLPDYVEWIEAEGDFLLPTIRVAASAADDLVLVLGDRTYNPTLFRIVREWRGDGNALALFTGKEHVGITALSKEAVEGLAYAEPSRMTNFDQLHQWIASTELRRLAQDFRITNFGELYRWIALTEARNIETSGYTKAVPAEMWQLISAPDDCVAAERKLDRWLMKPTDGIFAQANRRISIPISRWLIRYPITPNMVTYFTLAVSIAAGAFYALGGYWNTLVGAVLSLSASILDGCDGEVARFKLQSSDFGCWLDSVCDYLSYIFWFGGMAVGLARHSGNRAYFGWGAALLFGAVFTVILAMIGRRRLTKEHPEQYLAVWQKNAERRASNPIMYVGRYTEFMVRRCFLPYPFVVFAILNVTNFAFYLTAIGANIAWMISLYSNITFLSNRRAASHKLQLKLARSVVASHIS